MVVVYREVCPFPFQEKRWKKEKLGLLLLSELLLVSELVEVFFGYVGSLSEPCWRSELALLLALFLLSELVLLVEGFLLSELVSLLPLFLRSAPSLGTCASLFDESRALFLSLPEVQRLNIPIPNPRLALRLFLGGCGVIIFSWVRRACFELLRLGL